MADTISETALETTQDPAPGEDPVLNELYARVKTLALRKARAMESCKDETPEFDRGARTLGTLLRTALLDKLAIYAFINARPSQLLLVFVFQIRISVPNSQSGRKNGSRK